jgi:Zn-dependent protease with chaperone function
MASVAIDDWLCTFPLDEWIRNHVAAVFENLPDEVRVDLMDDPDFMVWDYDPGPQVVMNVPVRFSVGGKPGRSIVIKRTIKRRPIPFVRWVIAHELAHAYLRHGGRWPNDDPEHAADSLAADWGFPKPEKIVW